MSIRGTNHSYTKSGECSDTSLNTHPIALRTKTPRAQMHPMRCVTTAVILKSRSSDNSVTVVSMAVSGRRLGESSLGSEIRDDISP